MFDVQQLIDTGEGRKKVSDRRPLEWTFHMHVNMARIESFTQAMSSCDVAIIDGRNDVSPDRFSWSSPHLNGLTDPAELGARAAAMKAMYDGAMILGLRDRYSPWQLNPPIEHSKVVQQDLRLKIPAQPFSPDWEAWTFEACDDPFRHPVSTYLFLAHFDETVKHMLVFLGVNGATWISLYALKDFVGRAGWEEDRMALGAGVTTSEIERFRRTANSFEAVGPFARHGQQGHQPPSNPMTLEEARKIICDCVEAFFTERARAVDLAQRFEERTR